MFVIRDTSEKVLQTKCLYVNKDAIVNLILSMDDLTMTGKSADELQRGLIQTNCNKLITE